MSLLFVLACTGEVVDTGNENGDADNDGFVSSDDCHDRNADVYPGAPEDCNGVDDDCDGLVDEGTTVLVYEDADGDGFGGAELGQACADEGVEVDGDCDDALVDVNPDATEVCNDGLDNDCDPATACALEGELLVADAAYFGVNDDDAVGGPVRGLGDLDGDGVSELAIGAAGVDGPAGENTGAIYFYSSVTAGTFAPANDATAVMYGLEPGDGLSGVWGLGDGLLAVAARNSAGGAGTTYVLSGMPEDLVDLSLEARLVGESTTDASGVLSPAGDANGDGTVDLLVTAPKASTAWLALGPFTGVSSLGSAHAKIVGEDGAEQVGGGVTATDVNGDGVSDVVLGAPFRGAGGEVLVFVGPLTGLASPDDADAVLTGSNADDIGWALSPAGDHDGDGNGDFWASATRSDAGQTNAGAVYLVRGPVTSGALADATVGVLGDEAGGNLAPNHGDGDVNADGNNDLAVGCRKCGDVAGAAWLFHGPVTAVVGVADADAFVLGDDSYAGGLGAPVNLSDVNGDGSSDLLLGARSTSLGDAEGTLGLGAAYVYFGQGL